jgi:DinB family protein
MSTAKTGPAVPDPQAYRENLLRLLGPRQPLEVLPETASTLGDIVGRHSTVVLRTRPFEGKWSPNEIIGHLTDSEWVYGYRLRRILSEDEPKLTGTKQDLWVARQRHNEREPLEHLQMFQALRQCNLTLWKRMSPADWRRTGLHNERGLETLELMLRMMAGHDLSHLGQINRYVQAVLAQ